MDLRGLTIRDRPQRSYRSQAVGLIELAGRGALSFSQRSFLFRLPSLLRGLFNGRVAWQRVHWSDRSGAAESGK